MRRTYIGELEEVILLMVVVLQDEAYSLAIKEEIDLQLNRKMTISAVHATLCRLEDKGYLESHMGGATAERGGRRKRFFTITKVGSQVLSEIQESRSLLWSQLPPSALLI